MGTAPLNLPMTIIHYLFRLLSSEFFAHMPFIIFELFTQ